MATTARSSFAPGLLSSFTILAVVLFVAFIFLGALYLAAMMGELDSAHPKTSISQALLPLVTVLGFPGWWTAEVLGCTAGSNAGLLALAVILLLNSLLWGCGIVMVISGLRWGITWIKGRWNP